MPAPEPVPARLHVLLARTAPVGVVIRRGPSHQVCTVGWNRANDAFTLGQWLKGRIYERRSDLSPDGKHLIYFAMNGQWKSETKGSWTAISRAPYLKALGLWAKGDCWHGGGLFVDRETYWINTGYGHQCLRAPADLQRQERVDGQKEYRGECPGVYYLRLQRDGWRFIERRATSTGPDADKVDVFEKSAGDGWVLRKLAHATSHPPSGTGCYYDEHELENWRAGEVAKHPRWEWADLDRNRLVWAEGGKLRSAHVTNHGLATPLELYDFNGMRFEPIEAPY
jgi:hypothetical protein